MSTSTRNSSSILPSQTEDAAMNMPSILGSPLRLMIVAAGQLLLTTTGVLATQVPTPTASPHGGTYTSAQVVTASDTLAGSAIHYTTDGSYPTSSGAPVFPSWGLTISTTTTLNLVAYKSGYTQSTEASYTYVITAPPVADPTLSVTGGTYSSAQTVVISDSTSGATINYTLDGTTPTTSSPTIASGGSLTVNQSETLKVQAKSGTTSSNIVTANYTITGSAALTPVQLQSLNGILGIASGDAHSLTFKSDGTVWSWGNNTYGQLGNDSTTASSSPVQSSIINNAVGVAAGYGFSMAIGSDGSVWTWGKNDRGQQAVGTGISSRNFPITVRGLSKVIGISAGAATGVAVKSDGTVWSWGAGTEGELGDGNNSDNPSPVMASGISSMVQVVAGNQHIVALKNDGTVWSWGSNSNGQLGNNSTTNSGTPIQITSLSGMVQVAAGTNFSAALKNDGTVWTWGRNADGELGNGTTTQSLMPVQVSSLTGIVAIISGAGNVYALKGDGSLWTWGLNAQGQLGNGSTTSSSTPLQVTSFTSSTAGITSLSGGSSSSHALALIGNNAVYAWGDNASGDLGDGTTTQQTSPVLAASISSAPPVVAPTITLNEPDGATLLP